MRRGYIRAWDTARPTRYILGIQPAKNLWSWGIKIIKIVRQAGKICTLNKPLHCPKNGEHLTFYITPHLHLKLMFKTR